MVSWLGVVFMISEVGLGLAFLWRMRVEEAALVHGLGAEYREYMGRTRRVVPAIY
jgi:protein-S-isoprenylcysteine O-methyltransferase Ste14